MQQFGTSGECMDHTHAKREKQRLEYLEKYPTRWLRFLHWIGWKD